MKNKALYRYNPDTDRYERVYPSVLGKIIRAAVFMVVGIIAGGLIFLSAFYALESPDSRRLRQENSELKAQYRILNKRLDASIQVMDHIRARDDNYYRVFLQLDPMSASQRLAGLDNEDRYKNLRSMSNGNLYVELTKGIDMLDRLMYAQTKSFDMLKAAAMQQQDKLNHIPSIFPVNIKDITVASGYGPRVDPVYGTPAFHAGLDIPADEGEPVFATADGQIVAAGWVGGYGNCIDVDHGYNYLTRYGHLSKINVIAGQSVKRGYKIGEVGSTGKSTGPHLHYEVRFKGEPQNPVNYYFMDLKPDQYEILVRNAEDAGRVMD